LRVLCPPPLVRPEALQLKDDYLGSEINVEATGHNVPERNRLQLKLSSLNKNVTLVIL
jgi:hypothetical protein